MNLALLATLPQTSYAYTEEKAWLHAKRYGMKPEKFRQQHPQPTHLEQIAINANIQQKRIELGKLFASWGTPDELAKGVEVASPEQSPVKLATFFPCPQAVQSQSFSDGQQ